MRAALFAAVLVFASLPAAAQSPPTIALPPALDVVLRDYERAWKGGQSDSVAALFTADGFALPSGRAPAQGRAAIAAAYGGPGGDLRLRAIAFATDDSVGYIIGAYRYGSAAGDQGKFVLALKRAAGGRWMIAADIDNSSSRPMMPAAPTGVAPRPE